MAFRRGLRGFGETLLRATSCASYGVVGSGRQSDPSEDSFSCLSLLGRLGLGRVHCAPPEHLVRIERIYRLFINKGFISPEKTNNSTEVMTRLGMRLKRRCLV